MGLTSLQVCMDTSDWMQDISSPPLEEMIPCSRPLLEKRLRPQPDPAKCPRCDSTNTKFCYYNNYSLSQPRYFCKTCKRYWTKGGSLRNVPVGGGCRKNKRSVAVKKPQDQSLNQLPNSSSPISLPHLNTIYGNARNHDFMENTILGNPGSFGNPNFKESKYGTELGFLCEGMGSREISFLGEQGDGNHGFMASGFHGLCSLGLTMDNNNEEFMEGGKRLDFPFEIENRGEMKPRIQVSDQINKPLCIEWQEQDNCEVGKDPSGYWSGLGTWSGLMNSYGTSTALVQNLD